MLLLSFFLIGTVLFLGRQYTVFDGLAGTHVEDIYQDRRGLLWIATADGGVSRFDGARFETFGPSNGLPHLNATTIAEGEGGLAAFDGQMKSGTCRWKSKGCCSAFWKRTA